MQVNIFCGHLAKTPTLNGSGDRAVAKFTLITNEYAGKDESGEVRERSVSIQFTAFRQKAETIAHNALKGDQLIVTYRIENNNYKDKDGNDVYGYNFVVDGFDFGAPGKEKRDQFNKPPTKAKAAPVKSEPVKALRKKGA
jgi:single-strand DNA-binding protein